MIVPIEGRRDCIGIYYFIESLGNEEMKRAYCKVAAMLAGLVLLPASFASALPVTGDFVKFGDGIGNTAGGEFNLDVGVNGSIDYIVFCLERNEYINFKDTFTVVGVDDFASNGGKGGQTEPNKDYLSAETKWLYFNYMFGNAPWSRTTGTGPTTAKADAVQNTIWYLEGEQSNYDPILYTLLNDLKAKSFNFGFNGIVKVLNLENNQGGAAQSMIIGEQYPVPEPATLFLFGSGLAGLAGFARRRNA